VAAAGLGLAGCSVGPDYEHPQTEMPAAWLSARQDPATWPSADWWRGFGSTQLVAGLRAVIPPLEQQLRQYVNALAILIGKLPEQVEVAPSTLTALTVPAVAPGLPAELLIRRPDIQEAEAQLVAANANVKAARAAFFPSITLTAEGGFESTMLHSLFNPASALYSVAAGITQPIFEGGRLEVRDGVKDGDEVVLNPPLDLQEGGRVEIRHLPPGSNP